MSNRDPSPGLIRFLLGPQFPHLSKRLSEDGEGWERLQGKVCYEPHNLGAHNVFLFGGQGG